MLQILGYFASVIEVQSSLELSDDGQCAIHFAAALLNIVPLQGI